MLLLLENIPLNSTQIFSVSGKTYCFIYLSSVSYQYTLGCCRSSDDVEAIEVDALAIPLIRRFDDFLVLFPTLLAL